MVPGPYLDGGAASAYACTGVTQWHLIAGLDAQGGVRGWYRPADTVSRVYYVEPLRQDSYQVASSGVRRLVDAVVARFREAPRGSGPAINDILFEAGLLRSGLSPSA